MKNIRLARDELAKMNRAPGTLAAWESDWKLFSDWCQQAGLDSLPASVDTLTCYITEMEKLGLAPNTMTRRVPRSPLTYHQKANLPTPVGPVVWELLANVRHKPQRAGNRSRAKRTISGEELRKISRELEAQGTNLGIRDRALIVFGFNSAMRRAEISALDLRDVEIRSKGLTTINILRSKTDQEGKGRRVPLFPGKHRESCPVRCLKAWLKIRGNWEGPLFCRLDPRKRQVMHARLGPTSINAAIQRSIEMIGLDGRKYGGHTLRASFVTAGLDTGKSILSIMAVTGHKNVQTLARYHRSNDLHAFNVLDKVC